MSSITAHNHSLAIFQSTKQFTVSHKYATKMGQLYKRWGGKFAMAGFRQVSFQNSNEFSVSGSCQFAFFTFPSYF